MSVGEREIQAVEELKEAFRKQGPGVLVNVKFLIGGGDVLSPDEFVALIRDALQNAEHVDLAHEECEIERVDVDSYLRELGA